MGKVVTRRPGPPKLVAYDIPSPDDLSTVQYYSSFCQHRQNSIFSSYGERKLHTAVLGGDIYNFLNQK
jgi:hypothetical protein